MAGRFQMREAWQRQMVQRKKNYSRQCTKCKYQASPTSGTLFHKVKFPLLKAFYIMCYMRASKKGVAGTELGRKLGLRQKTCWLFKQKAVKATARATTPHGRTLTNGWEKSPGINGHLFTNNTK